MSEDRKILESYEDPFILLVAPSLRPTPGSFKLSRDYVGTMVAQGQHLLPNPTTAAVLRLCEPEAYSSAGGNLHETWPKIGQSQVWVSALELGFGKLDLGPSLDHRSLYWFGLGLG